MGSLDKTMGEKKWINNRKAAINMYGELIEDIYEPL